MHSKVQLSMITHSIMTLSIKTLSIMTLSIKTLSIMTLSIMILSMTAKITMTIGKKTHKTNDTQHSNKNETLNMLL